MTFFHLEWGGSADLGLREIWPDGDAPEDPTVDDVIAAMRKTSNDPYRVAREWELYTEDVEVSGPGGRRSLARVVYDERAAANNQNEASS